MGNKKEYSLFDVFEFKVRNILNEKPPELESAKPFARFPPIFEGFLIINVGCHLCNTEELIAVHNTEEGDLGMNSREGFT